MSHTVSIKQRRSPKNKRNRAVLSTANKLHTAALEAHFGKIRPKIYSHANNLRSVMLVDASGKGTTYAVTAISQRLPRSVERVNERIKQGAMIGEAFSTAGFQVRKNVLSVFSVSLPEWVKEEFRVRNSRAKARISEYFVRKGTLEPVLYGTLFEIMSPEFSSPQIKRADLAQVGALSSELERRGVSKRQIWEIMGRRNKFGELSGTAKNAKRASVPRVEEIKYFFVRGARDYSHPEYD